MNKFITLFLVFSMLLSPKINTFAAGIESSSEENVTDSKNIDVYGTYNKDLYADQVLSVIVAWDDMNFTYASQQQGTWDPETHHYAGGKDSAEWVKNQASIWITNHSNMGVTADLTFNQTASAIGSFGGKNHVELTTAVGTTYDQAPSDTVTFTVGGSMSEGETSLGTITIQLTPVEVPACLDLTTASIDDYTSLIGEWMAELDPNKAGNVTLNLMMGATTSYQQGNEICDASYEYYDQDYNPKVDLVLYGITEIGQKFFSYTGSCLKSIRFPDATSIGEYGINYCTMPSVFTFDKVTNISNWAICGCTNLTSLKFKSVVLTVGSSWVTNPEQITITLNPNQGSTNNYNYPTKFTDSESNGYFGGVSSFKGIVATN